jgi:DNA end-binding protein Ku
MARRAYWRGYLRLSLVTCPVELFPASSLREQTHFHVINKSTGNRVREQMVDEKTGKVVDKEHKGRGYELNKDRYVEIDEDELAAVQVESTHTIEIDSFVPRSEIDNRYLDRPYYVVPGEKVGAEAFAVIRDAMRNKDRVALARIVMGHREHVIALEPLGKGILGTTLRYDYEVRSEKESFANIPTPKFDKGMVQLAEHILDTKAAHFDASKFKDRYEAALKALVKRKAAGKKIEVVEAQPKPDKVVNLMEALRQSIASDKRRSQKGMSIRKKKSQRQRKAA